MKYEDFIIEQKLECDFIKSLKYDKLLEYCEKENIPSPKIIHHDEGYDRDCFCQLCLSYGE
jgi:predicted acetyltransferase